MTLHLELPEATILKPKITVLGVGGAGGNATNNMIKKGLDGASFVVANTDAQALENSVADKRIQLGRNTTKGLGAGAAPDIGGAAADEAKEEIREHLDGSNMVFVTAGMGGGTGTGAAPVIASIAREMGILTVGVVTKPFHFEGPKRMRIAEAGLEEMQQYVDTLIIIPNQNLFRVANEGTTFAEAFGIADEVLCAGVRSITDLMVMPGLINLDFADVKAVMTEMGNAMMGTGEAEGDRRAQDAAEAAISNPLLDSASMRGARGVLINITGGSDMTLFEVDEAANRIREEVDEAANIIFGSAFDDDMIGKIRVSVVATGIGLESPDQGKITPESLRRQPFVEPPRMTTSETSYRQSAPQVQENQAQNSPSVEENTTEGNVFSEADSGDNTQDSADSADNIYQENITEPPKVSVAPEDSQAATEEAYKKLEEDVRRTFEVSTQEITDQFHTAVRQFKEDVDEVSEVVESRAAEEAAKRKEPYIPPAPVAPKSYVGHESNFHSSTHLAQNVQPNAPSDAEVQRFAAMDSLEQEPSSGGLFKRMARMAKSFRQEEEQSGTIQEHEHTSQVADKEPEKEMVGAGGQNISASRQKDELLDIPAFLRRK